MGGSTTNFLWYLIPEISKDLFCRRKQYCLLYSALGVLYSKNLVVLIKI